MKIMTKNLFALNLALALSVCVAASAGAQNIMREYNGNFADGLDKWLVDFPDHDFLKKNIDHVALVDDGAKKNVLKFTLTHSLADNQGVQALSLPIPIDSTKRYRLSATARADGPNARIYCIGKIWHPKAKRDQAPTFKNTRDSYRGPILSFNNDKAAQFSNPKRNWATASVEIPPRKMTDLHMGFWKRCLFLEIHVISIGGKAGEFFLDEIKLEELGPIDPSAPRDLRSLKNR